MPYFRILLMSVLISLSCSYIIMSIMVFTSNAVMTGRDLLEEIIIAIILGVVISLLSLIFEVERIQFLAQLVLHFMSIITCVFIAGYFGNWYDISNFSTILVILILTIVIYGCTWWIMQNLVKKDIDALNKTIKQRRGELK